MGHELRVVGHELRAVGHKTRGSCCVVPWKWLAVSERCSVKEDRLVKHGQLSVAASCSDSLLQLGMVPVISYSAPQLDIYYSNSDKAHDNL